MEDRPSKRLKFDQFTRDAQSENVSQDEQHHEGVGVSIEETPLTEQGQEDQNPSNDVKLSRGHDAQITAPGRWPIDLEEAHWTPFHHAAAYCTDRAQIMSLLDMGFDPGATLSNGLAPIHLACIFDNMTMVRFLREESEAYMEEVDVNNWCPIHYCAFYNRIEISEYLFDNSQYNSPDWNSSNGGWGFIEEWEDGGAGPADVAKLRGHAELMKLMVNNGIWICQMAPEDVVVIKVENEMLKVR